MNVIQKALEMQGVDVAWSGALPDTSTQITNTYLNSDVDGFPRIVRTDVDDGSDIDIEQLRIDFDILSVDAKEAKRIAAIKKKAGEIIYTEYSDEKQRNLTARGLELIRDEQVIGSLTLKEVSEVQAIEAVWAWIKSVRTASDVAEADGTLAHLIDWPPIS